MNSRDSAGVRVPVEERRCERCGGTGEVAGPITTCPECQGFGQFSPCPLCRGTGCWDCNDGEVAGP